MMFSLKFVSGIPGLELKVNFIIFSHSFQGPAVKKQAESEKNSSEMKKISIFALNYAK